jgi:hypothetical protein
MKKLWILGVVIMALFGSMAMTGCDNGTNPDQEIDDPYHWNDYKDRVIEEKYRGTWRSVKTYNDESMYEVIVLNENWIQGGQGFINSGFIDVSPKTPPKEGSDVFYTEGTNLYKKSYYGEAPEFLWTFTSDTTLKYEGYFGNLSEDNFYKL